MQKKKTKEKKPKRERESPKPQEATVYIIGDAQVAMEYVSLCTSHGYVTVYDWNEPPANAPAFDVKSARRSAQIPRNVSFALELTNIDLHRKRKNLELLDRTLPATTAIASTSLTISATEQSSWVRHKSRLVGCCALPSLGERPLVEIAPTVFSPTETLQVVQRFFHSVGKEIELVQDRVGMVLPRILCQIINEAVFALQEEIAAPQDIDMAMKLGAKYPAGPVEWADRIGMQQVYAVLLALQRDLGEERYRVAPLLRQMAVSATWWQHPSATVEERQSQ